MAAAQTLAGFYILFFKLVMISVMPNEFDRFFAECTHVT